MIVLNTYNKSCFSYGQKLLHVKRLEVYETNADQLTNLDFGGVSSTCPTTKVILPHTWGKIANTGCLIVQIFSHYPCAFRLIIITLNDSAYMHVLVVTVSSFVDLFQMT